ncbi:MAG: lytic murein transglycosylase [Pseudomonadota bacterium]
MTTAAFKTTASFRRFAFKSIAALMFVGFMCGANMAEAAGFQDWLQHFKTRATARGIAEDLYLQLMRFITQDPSVYKDVRDQPEIKEDVAQYLNRRVSDWRIREGRAKAQQYATLLQNVERTYGVHSAIVASIWGMESSYGALVDNPKYMKPVLNSLATLAYGEPRRRLYWEKEFLNALVIVARGWAKPEEMIGSWAGAMGHTQWMPEVWLNVGLDFNRDGKISPFGPPDDALASTAQYLAKRGKYQPGIPWGFEVKADNAFNMKLADNRVYRSLSDWEARGLMNADGTPFKLKDMKVRVTFPSGPKGPGFALTPNFNAVMSYNPSFKYALSVCLLADRLMGSEGLVTPWPGAERQLSLEELQEMQQRLTRLGFDTGGTDGRVGKDTIVALKKFQVARGLKADGQTGPKLLEALRTEEKKN